MGNVLNKLNNKFNTLSVNAFDKKKAISGIAGMTVLGATTVPLFAAGENSGGGGSGAFNDIAKAIASVFKDFYNAAKGIVSIIAIGLIIVCLLLRLISKDQRKVDEATAWMKRIIITWLCFMFLGTFQQLIESIGKEHGSDASMDYTG